MQIRFIINKAFTMPPHIFLRKVFFVLHRKIKHLRRKKRDQILPTFSKVEQHIFCTYINAEKISSIQKSETNISANYLKHKFDLLGSGWVDVGYDAKAFGLETYRYNQNTKFNLETLINSANLKTAREIYALVDATYKPIDWQKDFKSGHRWSAKAWYLNQRNALEGVDIKVPWEIGRLQHLPQLALFALQSDKKTPYIKEFRNQILDFIALNPPRFGVQWTCTMDVGIRAANMLLAYDMFSQIDEDEILDASFQELFANSIYDHGLHIVNNLEYSENLTSNHYLSNIAGLLFVAAYLECSEEINRWLAFAVQEMISECKKQFYEDGSNFEASTSYHRLSTEIVVYATALMLGLPKKKIESLQQYNTDKWNVRPRLKSLDEQEYRIKKGKIVLPQWYIERLFKAGRFTYDISKPNGEIAQIGDNDSGRFVKLSPNGEMLTTQQAKEKYKNLTNYESDDAFYWDENIIDHRTLLSAMNGLFKCEIFKTDFEIEKRLIRSLAKNRALHLPTIKPKAPKTDSAEGFDHLPFHTTKRFAFPSKNSIDLTKGLSFYLYPDSGIYVFKSQRLYLLISAGSNGQNGNGGHAHNDKLSFELHVDGKDIVVDPGTYVYTPLPQERNRFRSVKAHNTLIVENEEQNEWIDGRAGLFFMKNQSTCYLFGYGEDFLDVGVAYRGIKQRRCFFIEDDAIRIENYSNRPFQEHYNHKKLYANGYGKLLHEK